MKFERTPRFDSDYVNLPREHQQLFRASVPDFHATAEEYVASSGRAPWPKSLRVRRMAGAPGIWEMAWSFSSPDGRATFEFVDRDGDIRVLWRRIGDHSIYKRP